MRSSIYCAFSTAENRSGSAGALPADMPNPGALKRRISNRTVLSPALHLQSRQGIFYHLHIKRLYRRKRLIKKEGFKDFMEIMMQITGNYNKL